MVVDTRPGSQARRLARPPLRRGSVAPHANSPTERPAWSRSRRFDDPAGSAISRLGGASGPAPVSSEQLVHDTLKRHRVVVMARLAEAIGVDMDRRDTRSSGADDIGLDRVADVQALIG